MPSLPLTPLLWHSWAGDTLPLCHPPQDKASWRIWGLSPVPHGGLCAGKGVSLLSLCAWDAATPSPPPSPLLPTPGKTPKAPLHPALSPLPKKKNPTTQLLGVPALFWVAPGTLHPKTSPPPPPPLHPQQFPCTGFSHRSSAPRRGMLPGSEPSMPAVFQGCQSPPAG